MEDGVRDDLRRAATFTSGVAEMTKNRAEDLVRNWVLGGDVRLEQTQRMVKDLIDWSTQNRKEIVAVVRKEIESQLSGVGVATRRHVERLERRVERLEQDLRSQAVSAAASKKTPRRKTTAKSTARRAGTSRSRGSSARRTSQG